MKSPFLISIKDNEKAIKAIEIINKSGAFIALVVDKNEKLIGTITDGDIRRGLLRGESTNSNVKKFMNRKFFSVNEEYLFENSLEEIFKKGINQIPLLDKQGRVKELLERGDVLPRSKKNTNDVVIMAGGKGLRLKPHTNKCPKPMIPINGKPMLEIILEKCIAFGFTNFYFSVNYLKDQIINYFGNGKKWGIKINYIFEEYPLGTAGSLKLLPKEIKGPILVLNGDIMTNLNFRLFIEFHKKNNAQMTIAAKNEAYTIPYGVLNTSDIELEKIVEKPTLNFLVSAGIYIMNSRILKLISKNSYCDMPTLISMAKNKNLKVNIFPIHEYWIDVGRPESLKLANEEWPEI